VHTKAISRPEFAIFVNFRQESDSLPEILAKRQEINEGTPGATWSMVDGFVMHRGRVFVPKSSALWLTILAMAHDTGHKGSQKKLHRLRSSYNPHTSRVVQEFVKCCVVCQRNKTEHLHPGR
jgi:hypothetical protein